MRSAYSFFFAFFFLLFFSSPWISFAQAAYQVELKGPETVENGQEVTVVLELKDEQGNPVQGLSPEISFDPGKNVADELLFDCSDEQFYDNCQANHQGLAGIFEISFVLVDQPVYVEVLVGGEQKRIVLGTVFSSEEALYEKKYADAALSRTVPSVKPASIQSGPWPSFWFIIFPFFLMMVVVTFFVKSTTK